MEQEAVFALQQHPLLSSIATADLAELVAAPAWLEVAEGTVLSRQGERPEHLILIVEGTVEFLFEDPRLGRLTGARLGAGDMVNADAVFSGTAQAFDVVAASPVKAAAVDAQALMAYLDRRFLVVLEVIGGLSRHLRTQVKEISDLKLRSSTERLASYLLSLAQEVAVNGSAVVKLPCGKAELAQRLCMEPPTLSRALARLRDHGVRSLGRNTVAVADVARLSAACAVEEG